MRDTFYLTIDGINCEAANPIFPNSIEVLSFSFMALPGGIMKPTNPLQPADMHIVKAHDIVISAILAKAQYDGHHFDNATLIGVRSSDISSRPSPFLKYMMSYVFVDAVEIGDEYDGFTLKISNIGVDYGAAASTPDTAPQPDQQHLINRLKFLSQQKLRKPQ